MLSLNIVSPLTCFYILDTKCKNKENKERKEGKYKDNLK